MSLENKNYFHVICSNFMNQGPVIVGITEGVVTIQQGDASLSVLSTTSGWTYKGHRIVDSLQLVTSLKCS